MIPSSDHWIELSAKLKIQSKYNHDKDLSKIENKQKLILTLIISETKLPPTTDHSFRAIFAISFIKYLLVVNGMLFSG